MMRALLRGLLMLAFFIFGEWFCSPNEAFDLELNFLFWDDLGVSVLSLNYFL